jgi:hypothetical protein
MSLARGPWYISARAVRDYLALRGRPDVEDGPVWDRAEDELIRMAIATVESVRVPSRLDSGALRYRGPQPLRLTLVVVPSPRGEGALPQLVRVLPGHERGARR